MIKATVLKTVDGKPFQSSTLLLRHRFHPALRARGFFCFCGWELTCRLQKRERLLMVKYASVRLCVSSQAGRSMPAAGQEKSGTIINAALSILLNTLRDRRWTGIKSRLADHDFSQVRRFPGVRMVVDAQTKWPNPMSVRKTSWSWRRRMIDSLTMEEVMKNHGRLQWTEKAALIVECLC